MHMENHSNSGRRGERRGVAECLLLSTSIMHLSLRFLTYTSVFTKMRADRRHQCWFVCKQLVWTVSWSQPRWCIFYNHAGSHLRPIWSESNFILSGSHFVSVRRNSSATRHCACTVPQWQANCNQYCIYLRPVNYSRRCTRYVKITLNTFAMEPPFLKAEQLQHHASQVTRTKAESRFQARLVPIQLW